MQRAWCWSQGAFGENLVIDGLQTDDLGVGSRLRIGPVLLELTQIGKVCHTRCAIYYALATASCRAPGFLRGFWKAENWSLALPSKSCTGLHDR